MRAEKECDKKCRIECANESEEYFFGNKKIILRHYTKKGEFERAIFSSNELIVEEFLAQKDDFFGFFAKWEKKW